MSRCSICEWDAKFARPTGPLPSDVLLIGEKPGREESYRGVVFIGDSGREVDSTYLPLAGLERSDVRVSNCVRCRLGGTNSKPTAKQIEGCASHHLPVEVDRCDPSVIVLLGASACSLVPSIEIDKDHGMPIWLDAEQEGSQRFFGSWSGWIWPSYHPAAALHSTSMMIPLLEDFARFKAWREGKWHHPADGKKERKVLYREITEAQDLRACLERNIYDYVPIDTENDGPRPWSLQFSPRPDEGYLVKAERRDLIRYFGRWTRENLEGILAHNAIHDLGVMEALGEEFPRFEDTMQQAYHLGNLPQGLKALGWRLLGIRMTSWEDLVVPHSRARMLDWLTRAWDEASGEREEDVKLYVRPKKPDAKRLPDLPVWNEDHTLILGARTLKPGRLESKTKWVIDHAANPDYDVWDKAEEFGIVAGMKGRLEEPPIVSIAHVPWDLALDYAVQDADICGQVATKLAEIREQVVEGEWRVPPEDWDQ